MRANVEQNGFTLQAIAGTYVVLLGWSMSKDDSTGILGFAIHRTDQTENEAYWLEGMKVFLETDPGTQKASFRNHPLQGFTWSDLTAKPGHDYIYRLVALKGTPSHLQEGAEVSVKVSTELESNSSHAVWFNRGAAASQEYARRFNNKRPDEIGAAAFNWLSRGLWEAMLAFISQANGSHFGLRAAVYQFNYQPALFALKAAADSGADVQIIYDARKTNPADDNRIAVGEVGIESLCTERRSNPSAIAHNKFIILLKDNQPISVWTGSTNLTKGGIFGQTPFPGLRYALLDTAGTTTAAKQVVTELRKRPDNRFAIGNYISTNRFDKWIHEQLTDLNQHAPYIHTKYMLIDPFGENPIVITGSANFSDASTNENDENMVVIRGEKTVADIYVTEFFRLWNHYAFRDWMASQKDALNARPQFLKTDDSWRNIYYEDSEQARQRQIMSGKM